MEKFNKKIIDWKKKINIKRRNFFKQKKLKKILILKKLNYNKKFVINMYKKKLDRFYLSKINKKSYLRYLFLLIKINYSHKNKKKLKKKFNLISIMWYILQKENIEIKEKYNISYFNKLNFKKFSKKIKIIFKIDSLKKKINIFFKKLNLKFLVKYSFFLFFSKFFKYNLTIFFNKNIYIFFFINILKNKKNLKINFFKKFNFKNFCEFSWIKYYIVSRNFFIYTPIKRNQASYSLGMYDKFYKKNNIKTQINFLQCVFLKYCKFLKKKTLIIFNNISNKIVFILNTILLLISNINKFLKKLNYYRINNIFFFKKWNIYSIKGPKKPKKKKYSRKKKKYFYF